MSERVEEAYSRAPISFSISGLPTGATATFTPTGCNATCTSSLQISASNSTAVGTYPITVTGSPLDKTTTFDLVVHSGGCGLAVAAADASDGESILATMYRFRDEVMLRRLGTKRYVDLFYEHTVEGSWILLNDSALRSRVAVTLSRFQPAFRSLIDGQPTVVRASDVRDVDALIQAFMEKSSPGLRIELDKLRQGMRSG